MSEVTKKQITITMIAAIVAILFQAAIKIFEVLGGI